MLNLGDKVSFTVGDATLNYMIMHDPDSGYFLNLPHKNDEIFKLLKIKDPYEFCKLYGGKEYDAFPYIDTLKNLTRLVDVLNRKCEESRDKYLKGAILTFNLSDKTYKYEVCEAMLGWFCANKSGEYNSEIFKDLELNPDKFVSKYGSSAAGDWPYLKEHSDFVRLIDDLQKLCKEKSSDFHLVKELIAKPRKGSEKESEYSIITTCKHKPSKISFL